VNGTNSYAVPICANIGKRVQSLSRKQSQPPILIRMVSTSILAVVEQDLRLIWQLQELCSDYGLRFGVARSAEEAILYLRGVGIYAQRLQYPLPGLILLDTENGTAGDLKLLGWLREEMGFKQIPIGLLASEPPHKVRVACAIDPDSFIIDRNSLWELPSLAWQIFFHAEESFSDRTEETDKNGKLEIRGSLGRLDH
jgi:hypothetical protein